MVMIEIPLDNKRSFSILDSQTVVGWVNKIQHNRLWCNLREIAISMSVNNVC